MLIRHRPFPETAWPKKTICCFKMSWQKIFFSQFQTSVSLRMHGEASCSSFPLSCGVPRESILGPLIFTIYMLHLCKIMCRLNITFYHFYVPLKPPSMSYVPCSTWLAEMKTWMSTNFPKLNYSKTKVMLASPSVWVPYLIMSWRGSKPRCHHWFWAAFWVSGNQSAAVLFYTTETAFQG